MDAFDKQMALDVIEDSLANLESPQGRGMATGLCGAFYMCGLLSAEEWQGYLKRIQAGPEKVRHDAVFALNCLSAGDRGHALN